MTTSIDTNVFIAFWDRNDVLNSQARAALEAAFSRGRLIVVAPVYSELLAFPRRTEAFLDLFFKDTGIELDWNLDEPIWRMAGRAFQGYAARRRRYRDSGPRRILADFLIGAHSLRRGHRLLTLDDHFYRSAFPNLVLQIP